MALGNPAPMIAWLAWLGANILATHLDGWLQRYDGRLADEDAATDELAAELAALAAENQALADEFVQMIEASGALDAALQALREQSDVIERSLQGLISDVQGNAFRSERLTNLAIDTVPEQGGTLRAQLDSLSRTVEALVDAAREARSEAAHVTIANTAPNDGIQGSIDGLATMLQAPRAHGQHYAPDA